MAWAHIINNLIFEIIETDPADNYHPNTVWVDIDGITPAPQVGWTATLTGTEWTFAAPVPPVLSLTQQAMQAMNAGLTITLSGSITLAATPFPTDAGSVQKITAVIAAIGATGGFPGGVAALPMRDSAGGWHPLTVAQYKIVAGAIAAYVAQLDLIIDGNPLEATGLPSNSVTLTV